MTCPTLLGRIAHGAVRGLTTAGVVGALLAPIPLFAANAAPPVNAQPAKPAETQASFESPEAAATALVDAARAMDGKEALRLLGAGAKSALMLTDKVAMRAEWSAFVDAYDKKHAVSADGPDRAKLVIGERDWEVPYPLVKAEGRWHFDTEAGNEEVVARRIGRNELFTIETMLAIVDAQREYAQRDWDGDGLLVYAAKFASSPGKKDGLYWQAKSGEAESPLGPLVAQAQAEGYGATGVKAGGKSATKRPAPYHGYEYRILTAQGPDAPGGAYDYEVRGKLLGGFAVVASPAQYGVTGVMSFIVNHDGTVFEKDLGADTAQIARGMKQFNPDKSWKQTGGS